MKKYFEQCQKLVILTIGNELRGDDGAGPYLAKILNPILSSSESVVLIDGGTIPENFTSAIKREKPSHLIMVDAVHMQKQPGQWQIIPPEKIANYNLSTHSMPLSFLIKYIETTSPSKILLLGVQPKNMELGSPLSLEVKNSIKEFSKRFIDILKEENLLD